MMVTRAIRRPIDMIAAFVATAVRRSVLKAQYGSRYRFCAECLIDNLSSEHLKLLGNLKKPARYEPCRLPFCLSVALLRYGGDLLRSTRLRCFSLHSLAILVVGMYGDSDRFASIRNRLPILIELLNAEQLDLLQVDRSLFFQNSVPNQFHHLNRSQSPLSQCQTRLQRTVTRCAPPIVQVNSVKSQSPVVSFSTSRGPSISIATI